MVCIVEAMIVYMCAPFMLIPHLNLMMRMIPELVPATCNHFDFFGVLSLSWDVNLLGSEGSKLPLLQ